MLVDPTLYGTLQRAEGLVLHAYWDPVGKVWTAGYGHTGPDVTPGMLVTIELARKWLYDDADKATGWAVHLPEYPQLADNQARINAVTEAVFNLGVGNWTNEFPKTRASIMQKDWPQAYLHLMASPEWIADVGLSRVSRIATLLRDGCYPTGVGNSYSPPLASA